MHSTHTSLPHSPWTHWRWLEMRAARNSLPRASIFFFLWRIYKPEKAAFETTKHSLTWISETEPWNPDVQHPKEKGWKTWGPAEAEGLRSNLATCHRCMLCKAFPSPQPVAALALILPQSCRPQGHTGCSWKAAFPRAVSEHISIRCCRTALPLIFISPYPAVPQATWKTEMVTNVSVLKKKNTSKYELWFLM